MVPLVAWVSNLGVELGGHLWGREAGELFEVHVVLLVNIADGGNSDAGETGSGGNKDLLG